jgi:hypothetical protein
VLSLLGLIFFFARKFSAEWNFAAGVILAAVVLFLLVLSTGATYAGIRHVLLVVVLLSVFAGLFAEKAIASHSRSLKAAAVLGYTLACVSAVPVLRPWQYFNELWAGQRMPTRILTSGGPRPAQQGNRRSLPPFPEARRRNGGRTLLDFPGRTKGRDVEFLGRDLARDLKTMGQPERSGTLFVTPLAPIQTPYWDLAALREVTPIARFGNLAVYKGRFQLPGLAAAAFIFVGSRNCTRASRMLQPPNNCFSSPRT